MLSIEAYALCSCRVLELLSCSSPHVVESSNRLAFFFLSRAREVLGESSSLFIVKGNGLTS